jgi:molybdopterin converting factor small subunit
MITIELYGALRLRTGTARLDVEAATLAAALRAVAQACPVLEGTAIVGDSLHPAYRASINGERFVSDPRTKLADGDALLLLAADAGG